MEKEVVVIARREDGNKNIYGALSTFLLFTIFLVTDIIFYVRDKATWQLVLLIISAVLDGFAVLGLLFAWSNYKFAKKVLNTPLITYDSEKQKFTVIDFITHQEMDVNKDDIIEIKISDKGESYLWYNKESKKTSTFIGYTNKGSEDLINNEVQKYKNLYC